MKKTIALLLALALIFATACGGTEPTTATTAATEHVPETTSEATTEEATTEEAATEPTAEPQTEPAVAPADTLFTPETYPRVDGATAMYPMSVEIAEATMGMTQEEAERFITHNTTAEAYGNLIDGVCDLIFVSEPSDDLLRRAAEAGVQFEMVGIGRDGFVFIVNQDNPVQGLSLEQIRRIYTGKLTNWAEVGGTDAEIIAYQREPNSGSQNLMEKMVMKGEAMAEAPVNRLIGGMGALVEAVASYNNCDAALGYSIYLYAKEQYVRDSIRFLSIDGVFPTDDTIGDGSYPLTKIVYAVFRSDEAENSPVRRLVTWLLTEEGQQTVTAGGYVGLK